MLSSLNCSSNHISILEMHFTSIVLHSYQVLTKIFQVNDFKAAAGFSTNLVFIIHKNPLLSIRTFIP